MAGTRVGTVPIVDDAPDYGLHSEAARETVALVRDLFSAFARRDLDGTLRHAHPDIELVVPATAERAGRARPYRGHDGVRDYFSDVERHWSELIVEAEDYRAAGESVIVFGRVHGRAGDIDVDTRVMWSWRVEDGQIISGRVFQTPGP